MFESYFKFSKLTILVTALFTFALLFMVNISELMSSNFQNAIPILFMLYSLIAVAFLCAWYSKDLSYFSSQIYSYVLKESNKQTLLLDGFNNKTRHLSIIIAAALSLFFELVMIRWQGSLFPVFAMYKNFTLLACFAGLGAGYAMARTSQISLILVAPLTAIFFSLFMILRYSLGPLKQVFFMLPFYEETSVFSISEALNFSSFVLSLCLLHGLLISSFFFTTLIFFPMGQLCGRLMAGMPNTQAYGF